MQIHGTTCAMGGGGGGGAQVAFMYKFLIGISLIVAFLSTFSHGIEDTTTSSSSSSLLLSSTLSITTVVTSDVTPTLTTTSNTENAENASTSTAADTGDLTNTTSSDDKNNGTFLGGRVNSLLKNTDAVFRAIYVTSGILMIILIYVFVRKRRKNKKNKWHKYGILTNSEVEMTPLDQGEDEEDTTMFDARTFRKEYK